MSAELLAATTAAVRLAGAALLARYSTGSRPAGGVELIAAIRANEVAVTDVLRPALAAALPGATWDDDEHGTGPMPSGDRWVIDPVGGNVNTVHGMPDWNIGVSLVRDGQPLLAVVYAPLADELFTAVAGGGARLNDVPMRVSQKTDLAAALVGTGQAKPSREAAAAQRTGASITAMLQAALYVRFSVPVTHQLVQVAAGRMDLHWQFDNVRSHIAPLLIVREAGGVVTHLDGKPWEIGGGAYLAAAPGLHAAALAVLETAV
ncbi:inositol monophosphatase family protein [Actinoplanes awajinensis]|uniref:3'(2'),5'-bisphosphate nucleotidase CysQ n=1 Tax=Actinoplanes awajinensis subsp. mycoplanecinus TaxID=135947 RepID=A0A0X3V5M9_9ACTN|nr:inositol monophosphatase family protein [Actinoplanes awajinensis]KUL40040.1 3'(2'),5'-bisphosphate nucleotidase CysQ [Actinoplanes awajinensis subsp. mycoplanecinus]